MTASWFNAAFYVRLLVFASENDLNQIYRVSQLGSRRPQEGRMPSAQGHAEGSSLRTGKNTLWIRKDDQEPAFGQGTTATHSSIREPHNRTLDKYYEEDLMQQSTPKGSDFLGFVKHGAKTCIKKY